MRKYTNKQGETIEVTEEHLSVAIKIKKELQESSPSRKCNWSKLVSMMEAEGFDDAESSENYRCMIKSYQKSIGELPEVTKYADMVADSKLDSIKELVGEVAYEKRENQKYLQQINKGKRELIDFGIISSDISEAMRSHDFSELILEDVPFEHVGSEMIVILSDLHIGALVDIPVNFYNFEVAVQRISKFASRIVREAKANDVTDLYVVNLGDTIEHSNMRYNQGYQSEFPFSKQIVKASDLIIKFLLYLTNQKFRVKYAGIAGNHDRITDKDKNIDGDNAMVAINEFIKLFIETSKNPNMQYVQAEDYRHGFEVNGVKFIGVHGDLDNKNDNNVLSKQSNLDNVDYDVILFAHHHTVEIRELVAGKYLFVSGSLKGADEFSYNKLRRVSSPSQSFIIVGQDGKLKFDWEELG